MEHPRAPARKRTRDRLLVMRPRTKDWWPRSIRCALPMASVSTSTSTRMGSTSYGVSTTRIVLCYPLHHTDDSTAYGYDCSLVVHNSAQLRSIATSAAAAIKAVSGTSYTIGPSCSTLYATTGSSVDYVDATGNATYSYTWELRDTGTYGFQLPASQIQPTVRETWAGLVSTLQNAG